MENTANTEQMDGFIKGDLLAFRAVLIALIATHPDQPLLKHAIQEAAVGLSSTAMQGEQAEGVQARFDRSIAYFLRTAELNMDLS